MSYNGVGLASVRGSGTSGYVQKNLSYVKAHQIVRRTEHAHLAERFEKDEEQRRSLNSSVGAAPDAAIVQHELKRRVELKVAELREKLTQGVYEKRRTTISIASRDVLTAEEENEIEEKVDQVRKKLLADLLSQQESSRSSMADMSGPSSDMLFIAPSQKKESDMAKVKAAIGIPDSYIPGQAFDKLMREQHKLERRSKREADERERMSFLEEMRRGSDNEEVRQGNKEKADAFEMEPSEATKHSYSYSSSSSSNFLSDSVTMLLSNATSSKVNDEEEDSFKRGDSHKVQPREDRETKGSSRKRSRSRSVSSYSRSSSYSSYTGSSYYSYSGSSRSSVSGSISSDSENEDERPRRSTRDSGSNRDSNHRPRRRSSSRDKDLKSRRQETS